MRPEDFSPGNPPPPRRSRRRSCRFNEAGGFLPRKQYRRHGRPPFPRSRFNEAGGFLPRKREYKPEHKDKYPQASMRPEDFSPGNVGIERGSTSSTTRFNEAGGFLPRKRCARASIRTRNSCRLQ